MGTYLWVAAGSALGGMARYWCSGFVAERVGETFPWGTLAINIIGSFVIGFFGALTGPDGRFLVSPDVRVFVMVGLCGGYASAGLHRHLVALRYILLDRLRGRGNARLVRPRFLRDADVHRVLLVVVRAVRKGARSIFC